jgi:hypothetical protein
MTQAAAARVAGPYIERAEMSDGAYAPVPPTSGSMVAPGWYPDPHGAPGERWWDGASWGPQTRAYPTVVQPFAVLARVTNSAATAALTLGIIAMFINTFMFVSLVAFIFSMVGLSRAGQLARAGYGSIGRAPAIWGLVLSILGGIGTLLFKALLF